MARQGTHSKLDNPHNMKVRAEGFDRMSRGRSALVALLVSAILLLAGVLAAGQNLQVVDVSGIWDNTVRTDGGTADGEGTASIRWGGPATPDGQSGYDFYEVGVSSIGPGSPVVIGRFNHLNFPVYPPSLSSADLIITIVFDDPRITDSEIQITIPFTHDETGNGDDPCDYPEGPNYNGCADAVFIGTVVSEPIVIGGIECTVDVWFGNGTNRYLTAEEEENEIDLYLQFSCPEFNPLLTIEKSGPATASIGDTVTYTFDVSHAFSSDGSPVSMITVTDSVAGAATLSTKTGGDQDDFLEDGETWSYVVTYTIQLDDDHSLINEGCVEGLDIDSDVISDCDTHTTTIEHEPLLLVQKSGLPTSANVGDSINYSVTVEHAPGSDGSPVDIDTVTDSLGITLALSSGDDGDGLLESGETWTYSGSREVLANDPVALVNEACVSGTDLDGDTVGDCDSTTTTIAHDPALLVLKTGQPTAVVGDTISYTITVQHHESSDGSPIQITDVQDSLIVTLSGPTGDDGDGWLQGNEVWTYIATRDVEAADLNELVNTFCASGVDLDGDAISDCDSTTTIVEHEPLLLVQKSGLPTTASVGDTVDYTITVEHAEGSDGSPVDVADVTDSLGIALSGPTGDDGDGLLESNETWTYVGSREVLPADPAQLVNEVCVDGLDLDGDAVSDCDSTTTIISHEPVLLVEKAGVPSIANVGNTIAYLINVQHDPASDNSPVNITIVEDSLGVVLAGPSGDDGDGWLEDGETWTYTGSRDVLPTDPELLINEVCVEGLDLDGDFVADCGDTTTTVRHDPVLLVEKSGTPEAAADGDTVNYTITVSHDPSSDGSPIQVTSIDDSLGIILAGPSGDDGDGWLEIGETWTYTGSRIVLDSDPHELVNTVCVDGVDLDGDPLEDCDSTTTLVSHPGIDLVKSADVATANIGETVTYTYSVENIGDVDLYGVSLVDDVLGPISGPASGDDGDNVLEIDETWIYEATHVVIEANLPGPLVNVATAEGTPIVGDPASDTDSESVQLTSQPAITVAKSAAPGTYVVGDSIVYTYIVTNTGDVSLSSVTVDDDILGTIALVEPDLAPGESTTGTASHIVTQVDMDAGEIVNVATATGTPPAGPNVDDTATETVSFDQSPGIDLVKTAASGPFGVGSVITYDYLITNTGNVTLTNVTLVDDILGTITPADNELAPGNSTTGTASHTITQDDVDAGEIVNIATTTGTPPFGPDVEDSDSETVNFDQTPSIDLVKTATDGPFVVGNLINYDYQVTNAGNVTLTSVMLVDDILGTITLADTELAPGDVTTGTASHTVTQGDVDTGQVVNIATATGTPPFGPSVDDTDTETVSFDPAPSIDLVKTAADGPFVVGNLIDYDYQVTNTGNVTLTAVAVSDDILGTITLADTELAPGNSTTGTASHTVTQDDVDAGQIINIATATGTPPSGPTVDDSDSETVSFDQTPSIHVVKTAATGPFVVGSIIDYDYLITNDGNVTLTAVAVSDDILGTITLADTELAPGNSTTGTASHTVTQDDVDAGEIVNVATTTGTPPSGPNVQDSDDATVTFGQTASIDVVKTAASGPFSVGSIIGYDYTVTNDGNVTLSGVTLVDDILGTITLTDIELAPGDSATGTASHTVTQDDVDAGSIVNIATATGAPPSGPNVQDNDDATVTFGQAASIDLVKTAEEGPFIVGNDITYDYLVTNNGNVTLTGVTLVDDILGTITLADSELLPGEATTGTASHTVTQDDVDAGEIVNVATTTGTPPSGPVVQDTDTETVRFDPLPSIDVVKVAASGTYAVGSIINYDYTVTNNGNVTLSGVVLADDILGTITLADTELSPGDATTGTASHTVTQDDVDAGSIVNIATATGTPPYGPNVHDTDTETVALEQNPSIDLVKTAAGGPFALGNIINYDYEVTNTGDVTLTDVVLVDDILGTITLADAELAPGESTTGSASHTVTQDDMDAGSIVNIATTTGTPPFGPNVEDTDTETVELLQNPSIDLVKIAESGSFVIGNVIDYDYTVTNDGDVTLAGVTLVDDILGTITLADTELAPGESTTGTASHTVTQDDVDAGSIVNIATTTGTPPAGENVEDTDTETVTLNQSPSIDVVKTAAEGPFVVGNVIGYDYLVTNDGNVTLTAVAVSDDILGAITLADTELAPGESTTGSASHTVTQDDVDSGSIVNVATATGTPPSGGDVQDTDDATVALGQTASIDLTKTAADGPFVVGSVITYDYLVTNNGNVTLTGVILVDDILGTIALADTTLLPGESTTGSANHTVTQDDVDAGSVVNVATTTGTPPTGPVVQDTDTETVTLDQTPSIDVVKIAAEGPFVVDSVIDYDYTVTNDGNVTLTGVVLVDDILGTITLAGTELAPGSSTTGTATHTVTQADMDAGDVVNVATATGTPPSGPNVDDADTETVTLTQVPSIDLVKTAADGSFVLGNVVNYDYDVTNNGNVTLTGVVLVDDILGAITLADTELAPGESTAGSASHTVTQADVDAGEIVNIATTTGTPPSGPNVEDTDTETVELVQNPSIDVVKTAADGPFAAGNVINYDYTVTNDGDVTLTSVSLVDDILGAIALGNTELAPGESTTGSASHTVTQIDVDAGSIVNIATAAGMPPAGPSIEDTDTETVDLEQSASIDVVKTAESGSFVVGNVIDYDYKVTNDGNVTLTGIVLVDDILGTITLADTELAPGEFTTGTASHTVTQSDVDAGSIVNVVTATGTPPSGPTVVDSDDETVSFNRIPSINVIKTAAEGSFVVGSVIDYDYTVINDGNVTLTGITLVDDILGTITLGDIELAPGDSTTGTASHIVTQSDVDAGSIVNVATATGTAPDSFTVEDTDDATVAFGQTASIDVDKMASEGPFIVGNVVTYDYTVTNDGNVTLTNITLTDDILGAISLADIELVPGESTVGTAQHTVTQSDMDTGEIINVATAMGTPPSGPDVQSSDTETVSLDQMPSIDVVKTAAAGSYALGGVVVYDYEIINDGNVTLTGITLVDDILGTITLSATELAPRSTATGTASHTVTQDDMDAGSIVNIATGTGTSPMGTDVSDTDTETVTLEQTPSIEIVKTALTGEFAVGDTVDYDYVVSNDGNVTLTGVTLVDDILGTITLADVELLPGESTTGNASHTVTQDDVDAGEIVNIATATGTPPSGPDVQDTDTEIVELSQTPSINVAKTASSGNFIVGSVIDYDYVVSNDGNVSLTGVALTDDILGTITLVDSELAPGESTTGTASHIVTQDDVDAGSIINVATATGTPPFGPNVEDTDTETVNLQQNPSIDAIKTAAAGTFIVGNVITYDYTVTNDGDVTLTGITLVDDILGIITLADVELAPGASTSGTGTHVVTQSDMDAGSIVNVATATGTPPSGPNVEDTATETVELDQAPELSIEKTGDAGPITFGDSIDYVITIENVGNITLHNVTVDDALLGISQNLGTMAPGDIQTLNASYGPIDESDYPGPVVNIAIADSDETPPSEDDHTAELAPMGIDLSLTKSVDNINPEAGELVTFTITVTNDPNVADATGVQVTDTLPAGYAFAGFSVSKGTYTHGGLSSLWSVGDLDAGESATLQVFATVLENGDHLSPAEVTAHDQDDVDSLPANADLVAEDDDDDAVVFIDTPIADLLVLKNVDNAAPLEGDQVTFTISVYNGGPYVSTGIVLEDALPAGLTYVSDTSGGTYSPGTNAWDVGILLVGQSVEFTITVLIDQGTAGTTITNTALILANEVPDPSPANNRDSAEVTVGESGGGGGTSDECDGKVIISEIAWAGTAADPEHEWIELRNIGGEAVDLTGWILRWRKKQPVTPEDFEWKTIQLSGELQASATPVCELTEREPEPAVEFIKRDVDDLSWLVVAKPVDFDESYMLLERKTDQTVSNVDADIVYDELAPYRMELSDEGDIIELLDANGEIADTANAFASYEGNWPAGDLVTRGTMERIDPLGEDERDNWHTNLGIITRGLDANGQPLIASSDVINSQTLEEMELFADLDSAKTLPGARLEVGLDLSREDRLATGWPWIRITRPGVIASVDTIGGGGGIEPVYSFASRYVNSTYWLGVDTAGLTPGDYLVWVVYGESETILVPITILE